MRGLAAPLQDLAELESIEKFMKNGRGILEITGCMESQKAHLIYGLSEIMPFKLIVAEDEQRAREIYDDYRFYDRNVAYYPAKDFLFYQADIHGNLLMRQRMKAIKQILEGDSCTVITTVDGCMDYLPPLSAVLDNRISFTSGGSLNMDDLGRRLVSLGYERVALVELPGQFSVRGGIIDIYSLTEENPWRIELWGDEIDSIRSFDIQSQRSIENLDQITIYPGAELYDGKSRFRFVDYFPDDRTVIYLDEPNHLWEEADRVCQEYLESRKNREESGENAMMMPDIVRPEELIKALNERKCISLSMLEPRKASMKIYAKYDMTVRSISSYNNSFELLVTDLDQYKKQKFRVVLLCGSRTRAGRLAKDLQERELNAVCNLDFDREVLPGEIMVGYGHARKGFAYPLLKFVIIAESDIFGQERTRKKPKKKYNGQNIQSFTELNIGDYVVHERYGVGVYRGIVQMEVDYVLKDYVKLEYLDGGNLYIQAAQLDALQKYADANTDTKPKVNKLGTGEWNKTRSKVRKSVKNIAKELVALYASRQQKEGYVYGQDTVWQREFEELFPYEETEDQLQAIEDTKRDMESTKIMDRLICGDVGYGKTEIALRAAFKAVQESRQVVYLVPTTILAQQHYNTFTQRMKDFPVRVDLLCRFNTPKQQKSTIEGLKNGLVDIVIGTHRVLSKDIVYKNLGLLIIDEEQRFGVTHKEKIKQLRKDVDVLTLTATPIPRTLHMSLIGIRDMSLLEEPPMDRMPIQTYVMEYDDETVREAINRELRRNGQVFYVYNRVNNIRDITIRLQQLLPDAVVEFAHGQMKERELEDVMIRFINREIDVLVSTTIIETGLDISNVNTMIIHDSDRYGLSQLYQLRGRIGRSNRTAYAFLMYRKNKILKETAEKRLSAIREYTDLGSGFKIAMRDLELRGAGNLLGAEQHGQMNAVGYDLYCKMLSEAVAEEKGEKPQADFDTTIDISVDAYIPERYIRNEVQKLAIYKRIAAISGQTDYDDMLEELIDRFGDVPRQVLNLLMVAKLRALAHDSYITEIRQQGRYVRIFIYKDAPMDGNELIALLRKYKGKLTVEKPRTAPARGHKQMTEKGEAQGNTSSSGQNSLLLETSGNLLDTLLTLVKDMGSLWKNQ